MLAAIGVAVLAYMLMPTAAGAGMFASSKREAGKSLADASSIGIPTIIAGAIGHGHSASRQD